MRSMLTRVITPAEIRAARESAGLTQKQCAEIICDPVD